ncbi:MULTISPECIES: DUF1833 family protein [unclassified Bradyrhizobium]
MTFGIEPDAARDGGETVTFIACPFESTWPEQRGGQVPSATIKVDNVNRMLTPKIRAAVSARQYIQVIYRQYLNSDLTEPAYGRSSSSCAMSRGRPVDDRNHGGEESAAQADSAAHQEL